MELWFAYSEIYLGITKENACDRQRGIKVEGNLYKTELHCHTIDASPCSSLTAEQLVEVYTKHNYDSVVITNHFAHRFIKEYGISSYKEYVEFSIEAYKKVKDVAKDSLSIIFGAELRFEGIDNDYLWIGADLNYLREAEDILANGPNGFREICKQKGWLFIQAHPFRNTMTIVNPKMIDGIEVFNGRHEEFRNVIAEKWAEEYSLIKVSGTDNHSASLPPNGGILTDVKMENMQDILNVIKSGKYKLIKG